MARTKRINWQAGPASCRQCLSKYDAPAWNFRAGDFLCLACRRLSIAAWRAERKSHGRPVVPGKASKEALKARSNRPEEKIKAAARAKTRRAYKMGKIQKLPCSVCGNEESEMHHNNYEDHMDITWFCRAHHAAHHAALRISTGAAK